MPWTDKTSTVDLNTHPDFLGLVGQTLGSFFSIANAEHATDQVQNLPEVRTCAAGCACKGFMAFGYTWNGACPTTPPFFTVPDLNTWGNLGPVLASHFYSGWTGSQITVPGTYSVGVDKSGVFFNVNTTSTQMASYFHSQAPGAVEYEVTAITATASVNPLQTDGPTDWTAILRKPATPDRNPHFIRPSELDAYPQIATLAPGASMTLTLPLVRLLTYWGGSTPTFTHTIYMSSDMTEAGEQDLGLTSNRYGSWLVRGISLDITWRYRTPEPTPELTIDDLGNSPRVYFEP